MITIAHVNEQQGFRGGEQQAAWLVRGLAERGMNLLLVGRPGRPFLAIHPEIKALRREALPLLGEYDLYSAFRLARITVEHNVDIIHAHTSHAHGIAALALAFGASARLIVSRRVNFMPRRGFLNRCKYNRADRIVCVSDVVHETMAQFGLPAWKLKTVHSAVDLERALMPPVERSSLGIPDGVPFLFSAGSLVEHKDHAMLLKAFALVRDTFPEARLYIAGDGPLLENLKTLRASLGLDAFVTFAGYRPDAPGICRSADVYVSSSWSEGLGTSILEALAAGTPVAATEAGGAREMVLPGKTGRLTPPRDPEALAEAVLFLLGHQEQARKMAERGREHVKEHFSVEGMVSATLDTYRELISSEPSRPPNL